MKYLIAIATTLIILTPIALWAQSGPGGSSPLGDPGAPIDGGITILAGAAIAYGARKLKKNKEQKMK